MNKGLKIGALLSACLSLLLLLPACCGICKKSCDTCPAKGEKKSYTERKHTRRAANREMMSEDGDNDLMMMD